MGEKGHDPTAPTGPDVWIGWDLLMSDRLRALVCDEIINFLMFLLMVAPAIILVAVLD